MKKIILLISLILLTILSGCSGGSGFSNSKTGAKSIDNSGSGLEFDFSIDDQDILSKKLSYNLNILNSGKKTIKLSKKNIKLLTIEKLSDGSDVLTKKSLDTFYSNIFSSKKINLEQNQKISGISGILEIDKTYFENINNYDFSYILNLNYDYQTSFSNNVLLDLNSNNPSSRLKLIDSLSQAAPVKISDIELLSGPTNNDYVLKFKIIDDNTFSFSSQSIVRFSSFEFKFKNQILNNCKYYVNENNLNKEIVFENFILNNKNSEVIIKCLVNLKDDKTSGPLNTIISGFINYNYDSKIIKKINLPKSRVESSNW